ncbi:MAG: orotate phosphoribosyltransferase [Deltaproteobacteria bacterium]|nr:orotate phosphoribosyltransferase [Deltaproteobacteria bacterium]
MSDSTKKEFLNFCESHDVIRFGDFTLKSGRKSSYFFNLGKLQSGAAWAKLGSFFADAIVQSRITYDVLFGPAYKGIPIVFSTAIALFEKHGIDAPVCFNRKEAKDHGEGGVLIGAPLKGRVLLVDDVITAGTAIYESAETIRRQGAALTGVLVALDREEEGSRSRLQASEEIAKELNVRVFSLARRSEFLTKAVQSQLGSLPQGIPGGTSCAVSSKPPPCPSLRSFREVSL